MRKTVKIVQILSLVIILGELAAITVLCLVYFLNIGNFQDIIKTWQIILASCGLGVFNCMFIWATIIILSSLRRVNDLKAADVIGDDIQEAYDFAQMGIAVTDDEGIVLWTNNLFKDRQIDIVDSIIYEWKPELKKLADSKEPSIEIDINSKKYIVEFLPDAGLWIFRDITDYVTLLDCYKDESITVGLLSIDNYNDDFRGENDYNDTASKIKSHIYTYAKDFGLLLRRIREDNYSILCTYSQLEKMMADNFSILGKVRLESQGEAVPLTLSLGFAHGFPDAVKLNDMAKNALDIAMSRGGDQVAVSCYGQDMVFYGGKTEAQEQKNRVKIRANADSLINLIRSSSNVLIMGHTNMDLDAAGACFGVRAICDQLGVSSKIVVDFAKKTEGKTKAAIFQLFNKETLNDVIVNPKDSQNLVQPNTLLVVVDVHMQRMVMDPRLVDVAKKIVVIDHHRRGEEYIENPSLNIIDTSASSTCELIAELVKYSSANPRLDIPATYATLMLSGIFLDTSFFKSKTTGIRTFDAASILKEFGADNFKAYDFLKDDYEEYLEISKIVCNLKTPFYGIVYGMGEKDKPQDDVAYAKAANTCLEIKGTNAAFIFGLITEKDVKMSCRSNGNINVQLVAEKLGGGGNFNMAAVVFKDTTIEEVEKRLLEVLEANLDNIQVDTLKKGA